MFRTALVASVLLLAACGSTTPPSPDAGQDQGECADKGLVHQVPTEATHLATCEEACGNGLNPPTGGPHCGQTTTCRVFTAEEPVCKWVHNLEHGHAVLLYNCPGGCPELVDQLEALWEDAGIDKRILITPWADLDAKVAAVVWGWSWKGDAVDEDAIRCVLSHQDEDAPEAGLACPP